MVLFQVLEILSKPVTEAGTDLLITLKRQAGYLFHYKRNIKNLKREVEKLKRIRNDVQQLVEVAQRNNEVILDVVRGWLESVQCIIGDVQVLDDQVEGNLRCFDLNIRYKLGKKAKIKIAEVNDLLREGNFRSVSSGKRNPDVGFSPDGDFSTFESTESAMKQVIVALKDEKVHIIGVYGMGGVGKTTLVNQVAKWVKKTELFEEIVVVPLSQNLDLKSIQSDIAEQLDMRLENGSEPMRARKLTQRLNQAKNVLVVLDNLWGRLELANVGIPHGEEHKGCSIIFTTRSIEICNVMECQAKIAVNILSEQDSWSLFREKAGDIVDTHALRDLAMDVAKECGGLPLAIVTLGRALRDKNKVVWKQVLQELQRSNPANIKDMYARVFTSLEMSYNYLESEEAKSCFLFCCLVPEGGSIHIHDLIRYGMGEGLFYDVNTLEEASGRVHTLIDKLKASCLLLEGKSDGWVKMHDVVRDVAISIASRHEHAFLVKAGVGLKEWPEIENPEKCKRISLANNKLKALPDSISCPQLLTLLLDVNYSLREIPESFFMRMKALRVLDLCDTNISSLPLSMEGLANLRTLWLDRCRELRDVALIGRLKKLEILSLRKSGVDKLPKEIGELTNLKLLDFSNTKLEIIPPNVISRLIRLEELYMGDTFSQWEPKGAKVARKASIAEIEFLTRLNALDVHVENINCMSQGGGISNPWKNLMKFHICIGGHYKYGKAQKFIKVENISIPIPYLVKLLFDMTSELHLVRCGGLTNFANSHEMRGENLESLTINECGVMEHVISVEEEAPPLEFRCLEKLFLVRLENLKKICIGPLAARCLINLRVLEVSICKNLINILPSYLVKVLCNLEKLVVDDCQELLEVFNSEDLVEEHDLLTSLKKLKLENLPKLSSVWKGAIPMGSLHNLEELNVEGCESLISFFSNGDPPTGFLGKLRIFSVIDCMKLTRVLPSDLIQGFEALEEVEIHHCVDLQELFNSRCLKGGSVFLPQLRKLDLCNLPLLTSIWEGDIPGDSIPNLEAVYVTKCHNLRYLFSPALAQCAAQLKLLSILSCEKMEKLIMGEICQSQLPLAGCFQNLQKVSIHECHGFKSLFSSSLARDLTCLNDLIVQSCHGMEVIITKEEGVADTGVLPQLKSLRLVDLPKLTSFYEEVSILDFRSLEFISLWSCPDLKWVPFGPQSAPNLKEVISAKWTELEELEWSDESVKSRFRSLFKEW